MSRIDTTYNPLLRCHIDVAHASIQTEATAEFGPMRKRKASAREYERSECYHARGWCRNAQGKHSLWQRL